MSNLPNKFSCWADKRQTSFCFWKAGIFMAFSKRQNCGLEQPAHGDCHGQDPGVLSVPAIPNSLTSHSIFPPTTHPSLFSPSLSLMCFAPPPTGCQSQKCWSWTFHAWQKKTWSSFPPDFFVTRMSSLVHLQNKPFPLLCSTLCVHFICNNQHRDCSSC